MEVQRSRRAKRIAARWPAVVIDGDQRKACTILDLSPEGAKLKVRDWISPRTSIALVSDKFGSLDASVVWCKGEQAGIRFSEPPYKVAVRLKTVLPELDQSAPGMAAHAPRPVFGRRTHHAGGHK